MPDLILLFQAGELPDASGWGSYAKVILLLAGMLVMAYVVLRLLRGRLGPGFGQSRTGHLEILDRIGLEPRRGVYLLRASDEYFVLVSSETGVQVVGRLNSPPGTRGDAG